MQWITKDKEVIRHWVDPVQTYNLIRKTINEYKIQAKATFQNYRDPDIRSTFTKLLTVDVALFNLFVEWNMECVDVEDNIEFFNPFEYFRNERYVNYIFYFANHYHVPLESLCDLRIVDINFSRNG